MTTIAVLAGLGNPGPAYAGTRHNVGFAVLDALIKEQGGQWRQEGKFAAEVSRVLIGTRSVWLVKPQTYVNRSGESLAAFARYHSLQAQDFAVVYDDITIDMARLKLSLHGGAGGHNGVRSVLSRLGAGFVRFRIGIGKKTHPAMDLSDFVLGRFSAAEQTLWEQQLPFYLDSLKTLIDKGPQVAMNLINSIRTLDDTDHK